MIITEYEHWLVVRQSRRRRIYRVTLVATVSRTLRTPLGARRTRRVVSCNYGGFISGACVSPRGVYAARVARQRGMGIPGDHVNRVETYQMELSVRLARWDMKSMPSELRAPHVLIAMMTRRMLGPRSPYSHGRRCQREEAHRTNSHSPRCPTKVRQSILFSRGRHPLLGGADTPQQDDENAERIGARLATTTACTMPAIVSPSQPIRQSAHISDYPVAPAAGGSGCTSDQGAEPCTVLSASRHLRLGAEAGMWNDQQHRRPWKQHASCTWR